MRLSALVALSLVACSFAPVEEAATAPSAVAASPSFLTTCAPDGAPRAVVATLSGVNEVRVLTQDGGKLLDRGLRLGGLHLPKRVAMRSDGAEAAIAWGSVSDVWGVAFLALAPDGSSATITRTLTLGTRRDPYAIAYDGADRVVVSVAGATHELVSLERVSGGFVERARAAAPGPFTFSLLPGRGAAELVASHVRLTYEDATTVEALRLDGSGTPVLVGSAVKVGPPTIALVAGPGTGRIYAQRSDPADAVTPTDLEGTGFLEVLSVDDGGVHPAAEVRMPRKGNSLAIDPAGRFLVLAGNQYELDPKSHTPTVPSYALQTVTLDAQGEVTGVLPETPPSDGLLLWDMAVSRSGHLLIQRVMKHGTVPEAEENRLEIHAQPRPGAWELCQTEILPGSGRLGLGP